MKKEYIKPEVVVEEMLLENMLATSSGFIPLEPEKPGSGTGGGGKPRVNDRRGTWGNLWDNGEN